MSSFVDWELAGTIAGLLAESGPEVGARRRRELERVATDSREAVVAYTGLEPVDPLPQAEWVDRRGWAEINLAGLEQSFVPIERRLAADGRIAELLEGTASATLGRLAGVQIGALVGYASRRVLGQFEFPILGEAGRPPRLLFVAANVEVAERELDAEEGTVLRWIALHEVTHAVHFTSTPWLRGHLSNLAGRLIEESRVGLDAGELLGLAGRAFGSDPRRLARELAESDPLTLLTPPDSRRRIAELQAAMAMVEGFAEHVMDAAAPMLGERVDGLRSGMERRREDRSVLAKILSWLLGMELKLRQYRDGKRFCDEVVSVAGVEGLNRAWRGPEELPSPAELGEPGRWIERAAVGPGRAGGGGTTVRTSAGA